MKVAVIGAGAAGMMAAGRCAELSRLYGIDAEVYVFDKNDRPGKKLAITGKGRCNLTNNCDINTFLENIPRNPRFLYSSLNEFSPSDTIAFFEGEGVPLKTERGRRVFPVSDKAHDIVSALKAYCDKGGVRFVYSKVTGIKKINGTFVISLKDRQREFFDKVIIATGGCSYPLTGSDGDGYRFARSLGIKITELSPSLVALEVTESHVKELMGLSLRNVSVSATDENGNLVHSEFGEMLFTHFGLSGPTILSMSAHLPDIVPEKYRISIDLKPALDEKTLDKRIVSDLEKHKNKNIENALSELLPSKMIPTFVRLSGIDPSRRANSITRTERQKLLSLFKSLTFTVKCTRPIEEAIITKGGVDTSEISPRTMEAKNVSGLYFAGEIIDVDAYTGGYNLQIAFATARVAAKSVILS